MAITTTLTALSTTATVICTPATGILTDPIPVLVQNPDAAINIFIGGPAVTNTGATTGIRLTPGQSVPLTLAEGDTLYAIAASATPNVCVMLGRQ